MSQENVEIVRRVYEAAASRDSAAVFSLYDPTVELDASRLQLGLVGSAGSAGGVYRGHEGLRDLFREWHDVWGSMDYSYEELIDAGESVVAIVTRHARGRSSGVEVERPFALVWTLLAGKVIEVTWFLTREEALEAAGST